MYEKVLRKGVFFLQVMDANSFLCEGGILHRERIFGLDNGIISVNLLLLEKSLGAKIACKRCDELRHPTGYQGN